MVPASTVQGFPQSALARIIGNHLRKTAPEYEVVANPGIVWRLLSEGQRPDTGFRDDLLTLGGRAGDAARPGSVDQDPFLQQPGQDLDQCLGYTSIPSVREILVLRADRIAAELLRRSPQGEWSERPITITEGDFVIESIDFRVAVADLYARTGLQTPLGSTAR